MDMKRKISAGWLLLITSICFAQTPGAMITTPITSLLNPNGDAWVTASGGAYITDDQNESELPWVSILQYDSEPSGDLNVGGSCGTTDIMDDPATGGDASYVLFEDPDGIADNGDEYMMYRLRIARDPGNGNFGFSVLMDIDNAFGTADGDSVEGNPGFEVEIRVVNGGGSKGVHVDDVRGTTSGTNVAIYNKNVYTQRSYALVQNASCTSKPAVFYDFRIPFSILSSTFLINTSTKIRLVGATSINGQTVLGNTASDIAGINDNNYANSVAGQDEAFSDFVKNQKATAANEATGFGTLPVELISFEGFNYKDNVVLSWATGMELNNEGFMVQKSQDGLHFEDVAFEMGQGSTSAVTNYSIVDQTNLETTYYRLKQIDFDGKFEYSKTIVVRKDASVGLRVYPNPATSTLNIASNSNETSFVEISNMEGKIVMSKEFTNNISETVTNFPAGWYLVKVVSSADVAFQKVLVK